MRKLMTALVAMFAIFASNAQAASKSDVWELLQRIDSELRHYDQSPRDLDLAMRKLEEALDILRGRTSPNPDQCLDFAYDEYVKDGYSNSISMEKARSFCMKVGNSRMTMPVVLFFYQNLKQDGYNTGVALDNAIAIGGNVTEQDLPCVEKAFGRYRSEGYGARLSLQKSVQFCSR
jgi:hypothetical protein